MADDVPVSDVLCEAMEYLSKLGSNLRARSENLKEKRIRKDKLKNFHSVQKAADKVLLICQLSKKSLENVECGVRRVLTLMNENQGYTKKEEAAPPPSTNSVSDDTDKYRYFKYRSYKLKALKKVPVKHFMSARVLARNMSMSMHDNYPVYHNCRLYRMRKRKENEKLRKIDDKKSANIKHSDDDNEQNKTDEKADLMDTDLVECDTVIMVPQKAEESPKKVQVHRKSSVSSDKSERTLNNKDRKNSHSGSDDSKNKSNKFRSESSDSETNEKKDVELSESSNRQSKDDNGYDTDNKGHSKKRRSSKSNFKKIRVIDDDSSDDNSEVKEDSKDIKGKGNVIDVEKSSDISTNNKINLDESVDNSESLFEVHKSKNSKLNNSDAEVEINKAEVSEISSEKSEDPNNRDTNNATVKPLIKCVNINKLLKPDIVENTIQSPVKKSESPDKKNESPKKKSKPRKILRTSDEDDKEENSSKNKGNISKSNSNKRNKTSSKSDEEFWTVKRNEASAFVSKKFVINLNRLPELTQNFLHLHNLRKIIYRNNIICELKKKDSDEVISQDKNPKSNSDTPPPDSINVVKNALLNDSDSEKSELSNKSPLPLAEIEKTVQNVLHNDPETARSISPFAVIDETIRKVLDKCREENKDSEDENGLSNDNADKVKNALLNDSDSDSGSVDKSKKPTKEKKETDLKQKLLAESDSENIHEGQSKLDDSINLSNDNINEKEAQNLPPATECQDENVEKETQLTLSPSKDEEANKSNNEVEISPSKKKKHKRKHIMESMHAKKMLLTYSSSSDTEDEQLRNALKEIKDSLLKGMSSSDDEKKKEALKNPASSDEDILKDRRKRKRNSKNSDIGEDSDELDKKSSSSKSSLKSGVGSEKQSKSSRKKMGRSRAQPGGSSQNSDSQDPNDKDIDGLTNLNSLTKNRRRRDSTSTNTTSTNSTTKKTSKMAKASLISEENMLKADSSSDAEAVSAAESDPGEDLPSISLSGLNGSGGDHLAKDDLLDESDTSASHRDSDGIKKTDDSDEDTVKLKRRKAHLISSGSEAGSSRKNADKKQGKLSDFEDSEDDSLEPTKRSKRKKKGEESDASVGSSSNDGSKKKRRRIKQIDSDASGSDTENEGRNKHGRKNIRKVMGKNQLEEATKKAAREEKERIARIAERQKVYNNLQFDETGKPDEVVLDKVVLDFDPETKEPLIEVDRGLVKKLKPHQANGIKFMWDACFESVKRIKKDKGSGCILAHCMGLGKTLQVVSLTHTLLTHSDLTSVNRVLVVCPLSTVLNWVNEFKMWLKHAETEYEVDVYELSRHKQNSERAFQLQQWFEHGGVCVLGYEMFRNLSADNNKKFKKKMLRNFQESLVNPGPDLVVCDEGHLLKNEKTSLSQSMNRVKTHRRIVLTGTPLQNNLKEYYCMVQFVKPNLLGKYNEYLNRFVNPITNGQYTDSTEHDIRIMKRRSHVLHKMLDGAVQRRDYGVLAPFLPPKHEYVLFITLTDVQIKLYEYYLDNYSRRPLPGKSSGFLFPDFQSLQRIWTHPLVLKYNSERYEIMQQKKREREEEDSEGSLVDFIDDDSTPDESSTDESSEDLSDMSDDSRKKSKKKKSAKKAKGKDAKGSTRRGTRANPVELLEDDVQPTELPELKNENPTEWWIKLVEEEELEDMRNSHKLVLLFDILRQCEAIGDKLLVFSQSLYSLDLIEHFLGKVDEATQDGRIDEKLGSHVGSWSPGIDYFRLDGSTSCENRSIWCKNFNREDNPRARLFLISTRAGGLGINLVAANRVVIFDVSWNPSHDVQSIFRVYRFGQKKPCYVYRFLAMGTMEEKIYERQVTKQAISKRVIDEQQIDRHYAENDLAELYKFEATPPQPRPIPPLPKDRLFAEMLREHEAQIYKYHEHDSLLENKEEETLSEEERKAAWEDFENEKNRPPPAPFPSAWPMHNGMAVPGLLAQQQQQLAYAALAAMLRKDMPNINDNQIRDMLPLIYNANPALMQKMSEIYKYTQSGGMMNPAMMNPVMNAAGGGGMGGTSGLQYEPPWQRQHQQQQQMRLQQLMQQNQMGAKYYAGGLGSRDPVAMAMQQQRAREIMSSERARPRGRPPLQPRAPMPPPGDVVNLDSD